MEYRIQKKTNRTGNEEDALFIRTDGGKWEYLQTIDALLHIINIARLEDKKYAEGIASGNAVGGGLQEKLLLEILRLRKSHTDNEIRAWHWERIGMLMS